MRERGSKSGSPLCAAFTPTEVEDQLRAAGLALTVEPVSERHMLIKGILAG
jgi:hypothetical protein